MVCFLIVKYYSIIKSLEKKMKISSIIQFVFFISFISLCGFEANNSMLITPAEQQKKNSSQLEDKGIGPVKEVKLGSIDSKLVDKGISIFNDKCSACHDIDDINLAPPLRGVTKTLSPIFIMNYLMNTAEMQKQDPNVINLIQQWKKVPKMKDQKLKQNDARAVLEYLRSLDK
jgi:mono/diheme cytochrome c family protein